MHLGNRNERSAPYFVMPHFGELDRDETHATVPAGMAHDFAILGFAKVACIVAGTAVVTILGGGAAWFAASPPRVRIDTVRVEHVSVAGDHVALGLVNRHPWKVAIIDEIRTSCGCARVSADPVTVAPLSKTTLRLIVRSGASITELVRVYAFVRGVPQPFVGTVSISRLSPFDGWPVRALARRTNGDAAIIPIDAVYSQAITHVACFDGDTPIEASIEPGRIRLSWASDLHPDAPTLTLTIGGREPIDWEGRVVLEEELSTPSIQETMP